MVRFPEVPALKTGKEPGGGVIGAIRPQIPPPYGHLEQKTVETFTAALRHLVIAHRTQDGQGRQVFILAVQGQGEETGRGGGRALAVPIDAELFRVDLAQTGKLTGGGQVVIDDDHPGSVRNMAADHIRRLTAQIGIEDEPPLRCMNGRQEGRVDPLDGDVLHRKSRPQQGFSENGARRDPVGVVVVDQGDLPARRIVSDAAAAFIASRKFSSRIASMFIPVRYRCGLRHHGGNS